MPEYDDTEAPVKTVVDAPDDFSGHMDDRPVKVNVDATDDDTEYSKVPTGLPPSLQVSMSPAEAYHFADDLQAAADACWGAAEYVVNAVRPDGEEMAYLTTIKAPTPDDAVRRALDLLEATTDGDGHNAELAEKKLEVVNDSDAFRVYRADSITTVRPDDDN
jgi:hypothetical protein